MSKIAGDPAGKHATRDPSTGRFSRSGTPEPAPAVDQDESPAPAPAVEPANARPSAARRLLTGSLGELFRG